MELFITILFYYQILNALRIEYLILTGLFPCFAGIIWGFLIAFSSLFQYPK